VDSARIAELLRPYLGERELTAAQLLQISTYINILTKWNEKTNLTAIREPEEMVRRHFGESLFAAAAWLEPDTAIHAIDVGSGAGFPGLPLKIYAPQLRLTLIEAHSKKNTFLREAIRALGLSGVDAYLGRAEQYDRKAELVTLRAVEKFESMLPVVGGLVEEGGRLALMIGSSQAAAAKEILPGAWADPVALPDSEGRVLLVRRAN